MKLEHRMILALVRPGSSVLDLGCGDGELLSLLSREKQARVRGIEIDEQAIYQCVAKGLSVVTPMTRPIRRACCCLSR